MRVMEIQQFDFDKPRLSIIIPVLNGVKYLSDTLESLAVLQGSIDCEIVFQNSCSTDGTTELLDQFCRLGTKRYHYNEKDSGQSSAINAGVKRSRGKWVTWLCADDLLLPSVGTIIEQAERVGAAICYGDVIFVENSYVYPAIGTETHSEGALARKRLIIQQPGTCILREHWQELGGVRPHLNWSMDYDFFLRLESSGKKFYRAELFVAIIRVHPEAKTSSGSIRRLFEIWSIVLQSHRRRPGNFRFRPYLVYGIEFIIKYLGAARAATGNSPKRLVLALLHKLFWVIAMPTEKRKILERFITFEQDTPYIIQQLSGNRTE